MRIDGWHIESYGLLRGYEVRDLGPGITVVLGPNETGKSTLLAFIRGVLFGFPDRRSRDGSYAPIDGGPAGGRLFLDGPEGKFTIERWVAKKNAPKIVMQDGRQVSPEDLARWMGGADETLFRTVFGFSLTELQSLQSLKAEEVRERIYSAHVIGAGKSARKVMDTLSGEMSELLRPRGVSRITELAIALEQASATLKQARERSDRYPDLLRAEDELRAEVAEISGRIAEVQQRKTWFAALGELLPSWQQREAARQTPPAELLAKAVPLEGVDAFRTSLAETESAITACQDSLHLAVEEEQRLASEGTEFAFDPDAVERAASEGATQQTLHAHANALSSRLASLSQEIEQTLSRLGGSWNRESVLAGDWSRTVQDRAASWAGSAGSQWKKLAEQRLLLEMSAAERSRIAELLKELESKPTPSAGPELRALRALRSSVTALESEKRALAAIRSAQRRIPSGATLPPWATVMAAIAVLIMLGVAGLIGRSSTAGAFGLIFAAILTLTVVFMRATINQPAEPDGGSPEEQAAEEKIQQLTSAVQAEAEAAGLPAEVSAEQVEAKLNAVSSGVDGEARRETLQQSLAAVEETERRRRAELESLEGEWQKVRAEWEAWRTSARLPESVTPENAASLIGTLAMTSSLLQAHEGLEKELAAVQAEMQAWEDSARTVIQSDLTGDELVAELARLRTEIEEHRARQRRLADITGEAESLRKQLALQERERERITRTLEGLEQAQPVVSLDTGALQELQRTLDAREDDVLARMAGVGRDQLREVLAAPDPEGWKHEVALAATELEEIQRKRDDAIGRLRIAEQARLDLEQSQELASCESEFEQVKAELQRAAREWAVASVARSLVATTLGDYTQAKQPGVLREASESFGRVTREAYRRVLQDETGQSLQVEDAAGRYWKPDELSRGTMEQLLVCLRLGLAAEFGRAGTVLPFVIDDVLVNFDPQRAEAAASELHRFAAESRQMLVFTCHPETAALIGKMSPGCRVIELERRVLAART